MQHITDVTEGKGRGWGGLCAMKWYNISLMLRKERGEEGRVVCDEMACGRDEQ